MIDLGFADEWIKIVFDAFGLDLISTDSIVTSSSSKTDNSKNNHKKKYFSKNQARKAFTRLDGALNSYIDEIVIPNGYTVIGERSFDIGSNDIKSQRLILPETIEEIQDSGLVDIEVTEYIMIPSTVVTIGDFLPFKLGTYGYIKCNPASYVYKYCHNNGIPNSVDGIPRKPSDLKITREEAEGFKVDSEIKYSDIGNLLFIKNARSVEKSAFKNRNDIEILCLGKDVSFIKQNAFFGCKKLKYVYLSDSVISIASNAFADCDSLKYIYFDNTSDFIKDIINVDSISQNEISSELTISETAFNNCNNIKLVSGNSSLLKNYFEKINIAFINHLDGIEHEVSRRNVVVDQMSQVEYYNI